MKTTTSKENILRRVREALIHKTPQPYPGIETAANYYPEASEPLDVLFAKRFTEIDGKFVYCEKLAEAVENLNTLIDENKWKQVSCRDTALHDFLENHQLPALHNAPNLSQSDAGLTRCEALIARTGSILLSSGQPAGRALSVFPPVHIVVAFSNQLVYDIKEGLESVQKKFGSQMPSLISLASGPSRTADIEKTLVLGAHGPKAVYVFLCDETL